MRLHEFLLKKTQVGELVQITRCGWNCAAAIIDNEDLFIHSINSDILDREVKEDYWKDLSFQTGNPNKRTVATVHIVEI